MAAHEPGVAQQTSDAFGAAVDPVVIRKLGSDPRRAIGAARLGVDATDHRGVGGVFDAASTRWSFAQA